MKFIVDAQLPSNLSKWLAKNGHEAIHTSELPQQNLTEDIAIIRFSMENESIIISKDSDFYEYFILKGQPHKLLMITVGNVVNKKLIALFQQNLDKICELLADNKVVELSNDDLIVHF